MKKLMTFCFTLLLIILSALSCFNFAFDTLDRIEEDKTIIQIEKPAAVSNSDFLNAIDQAVGLLPADIMLRYVENQNGKEHYQYFKTNHTVNFLNIRTNAENTLLPDEICISTMNPAGYTSRQLHASSLLQEVTFYPWGDAASLDLSAVTYFVKTGQQSVIADALKALGYSVTANSSAYISGQFSIFLFAFVPSFMLVASMAFYVLSVGKQTVLKKMEGYQLLSIMWDEIRHICPIWAVSFFITEAVTVIAAAILYRAALLQYLLFSLRYMAVLMAVVLAGMLLSSQLIRGQKSAEHMKGKVPRRGIYITTILAKCVFVSFLVFFLSIALRNAAISRNTMESFRFFADKTDGYVTVPVSGSNTSPYTLSANFKAFYSDTVNRFNGILIDASNYDYDLISGNTLAQEFGQTEITVNPNYLEFNPIYGIDGGQITPAQLSDTAFNVLLPLSKESEKESWRAYIQSTYQMDVNFISYDSAASEIYTYNAGTGIADCGALNEPVILVLREDQIEGVFVLSYCSKGAYFLQVPGENPYVKLLPFLQKAGIASVIRHTPTVADTFTQAVRHQRQMLMLYGTQSAVLLIGLVCLIIFSAKLYCENYRQKIALCLMEGYSLFHCIRKHLLVTVIYYAVVILCVKFITRAMQLSLSSPLLATIFLSELCITVLVSRLASQNNLYQTIKGAD